MQILRLKSVCRKKRYNYIKSTPEVIAENILNRDFHADKPNEKWLTDVTAFKYYAGAEVGKIYPSALLNLYDRRIVSYKLGDSNNNLPVLETLDEAVKATPNAHPLFHSDRGFQYTSKSLSQQADCRQYAAEYATHRQMHWQRSHGGILGYSQSRNVLSQKACFA